MLAACSTSQEKAESSDTPEETSTELTYAKMEEMVFSGNDEGERVEWHGQELNVEAAGDIEISESDDCACGKKLQITNNSDRTVEVVVQAAFSIEERNSHIARKYVLPGGASQAAGCSHLCNGDQEYLFDRKVVGAEYAD